MNFEILVNLNGDTDELDGLEVPFDEIVELIQSSYSKNIFGKFSYVGEARAVDPNQMSFLIGLGANATFSLVLWLVKKVFALIQKHPKYQCWVSLDIEDNEKSIFIFNDTQWEQVYDELNNMKDDINNKIEMEKAIEENEE